MQHQIVSRDEWLAARKAHLRNEGRSSGCVIWPRWSGEIMDRVCCRDEYTDVGQQTTCSASAAASV